MRLIKNKWVLISALLVIIVVLYLVASRVMSKQGSINKFKIETKYAEYISAVTTGIISSESTIKVVLNQPFEGDSTIMEKMTDNLFKFSPSIKGKSHWIDSRIIEFIPAKKLPSGQLYESTFNLPLVSKSSKTVGKMIFRFQIIRQDFMIQEDGFHCYPGNSSLYYLSGTLKTADVTDATQIPIVMKAFQAGRNLKISWQNNEDRKEFKFRIDSIVRTAKIETLKIESNGEAIDCKRSTSEKFDIPSLGTFSVIDARVNFASQQTIKIIFSDPVNSELALASYISLEKNVLKFSTDENIVLAYPQRFIKSDTLKLTIEAELKSAGMVKLNETFSKKLEFNDVKPAVELLGKGVVIPTTQGTIFPFRAVNLKAVDVTIIKIFENNIPQFLQTNSLEGSNELKRVGRPVYRQKIDLVSTEMMDYSAWNTFSFDLSKLIKTDPGAIYQIKISFRRSYANYPCAENKSANEKTIEEEDDQNWDYEDKGENSYWDFSENYYNEYGDNYNNYWENRNNPCHPAYYNEDHFVKRNVLASNMGMTAKLGKTNDLTVVVSNLIDASPISNVTVEILDFQQQVIGNGSTDGNGILSMKLSHKPFLIIAKKDKERSYLSLSQANSLATSMFEVGGEEVQKGLKGFIYGERGIWRPGDSLFITFILDDKQKTLPANHPVIFELLNPQGELIKKLVKTNGVNGFYTFQTATDENAPTGNWDIKVRAGGVVFDKSIKIEAIKPNRLKIDLDFGGNVLQAGSAKPVKLNASWLNGATARNLKTNVSVTLSRDETKFSKYPDYIFEDAAGSVSSEPKVLFEGKLDENGHASFTPLMNISSAPGFLSASFITKVFEEGGDFSIVYQNMRYSPFSYYAGLRVPVGDIARGMLLTDKNHDIDILTLDQNGSPLSVNGLSVDVYKLEWRWWWEKSDENLAYFVNSEYRHPIQSGTLNTENGKGVFKFRINYPEWGRYLIRVKAPNGHSASKLVYVDWPGWAGSAQKNMPGGASMLSMSADKESYMVGESARITIPAPAGSRALISVETGSQVINVGWKEIGSKLNEKAIIDIPVSADMAPNAYVCISLIQPYKASNDAPIRMYGYTRLKVEDPGTKLDPQIKMPDVIGSEQAFALKVNEKNGKAMTYTIALVDEGLLNINRFRTPEPWKAFYAQEALGVKSWDIFDLVFGSFGGKIEQLFAIGGDNEGLNMGSLKNSERFKPVVKYLGPFILKKGSENIHNIKLGKYIGAIRTMIIAGNEGAYGNTEKLTTVKNSLMVLSSMPRKLSPGESVSVPVTVFVDEPAIKNVLVTVEPNNLLISNTAKTQNLTFQKSGSQDISFPFKVANQIGAAKLKVTATSGNYKADYQLELSVRNPNAPENNLLNETIDPGKSWPINVEPLGIKGTNNISLELSSFPGIDLSRRLNYLIQYPHGCAEQITSSVFPQLYLSSLTDLTNDENSRIEINVKAGLQRLISFQTSDGGIGYWPGTRDADEWISSYIGQFMIEASGKGYELPSDLEQRWLNYQQLKARQWTASDVNGPHDFIQAYRLFTLALAQKPELNAMNRLKEKPGILPQSQWLLAAAYQIAGQEEVASQMVSTMSTTIADYADGWYTYGSAIRDKAILLNVFNYTKQFDKALPLAQQLAERLSSDEWYSTQSIANCLLAMAQFINKSGKFSDVIKAEYTINGDKINVKTQKSLYKVNLPSEQNSKLNITNNSKGVLFARIVCQGIPSMGEEKDESKNISISVVYKDFKGNVLDISSMRQGTDFKAEVTITHIGSAKDYRNMALSYLLPSGWEIINSRIADEKTTNDNLDYQDIRDDRIYTYFSLKFKQSKTFTFLFNAAFIGNYYHPGVRCEAMYDNNIVASRKGQNISIIK